MRVAVFGPSGMLGKRVLKALQVAGHVGVPIHRHINQLNRNDIGYVRNNIQHVLEDAKADAVINCAGVIAARNTSVLDMIYVNATFPHILCAVANPLPVVLVSTDCVFSGRNRYRYITTDIPDPRDYYGISKRMGEVVANNAIVVRTSFIGCEHGIMNYVLSAGQVARTTEVPVAIEGWKNALWSGSTSQAVAQSLVDMLVNDEVNNGIVHLSTESSISKHDLVVKLIEHYKLNVVVKPVMFPMANKALAPTVILQDIDSALAAYECGPVALGAVA